MSILLHFLNCFGGRKSRGEADGAHGSSVRALLPAEQSSLLACSCWDLSASVAGLFVSS